MFYSTRRRSAPMTPEQTFPRGRLRVEDFHMIFAGKCGQKRKHLRNSKPYFKYFSIFFNIFHSQTPWPTDRSWDVTCHSWQRHISEEARQCDLLILWLDCDRRDLRLLNNCNAKKLWCGFVGPKNGAIQQFWSSFLEYTMNPWYIDGKCAIKTHKNTYFHRSRGRLCFGFEVKAKTFASRCWNWHCLRWALDGRAWTFQDVPLISPVFMAF